MSIPISTFTGTLRQITPEVLNAQGAAMLRACAPGFFPLTKAERQSLFDSRRDEISPYVTAVYVPARPLRRFSGDYFSDLIDEHRLDVGCYYSVCADESGFDYGTLANELNAYRSTDAEFHTLFLDCLSPQVADRFQVPRSPHILLLVQQPAKLARVLPTDAPEELRKTLAQAEEMGTFLKMTLGCALGILEVEDVIDLRQIDAQEWFFQRYVPKGPIPTPANEFIDILPELLLPDRGGPSGSNVRLQSIGADMRRLGIGALIYPSARSDVRVAYSHGNLVRWKGWNMVVYRGGTPRKGLHIDFGPWETRFWGGIVSGKGNRDAVTQEWGVVGLEEWNLMQYEKVMESKNLAR